MVLNRIRTLSLIVRFRSSLLLAVPVVIRFIHSLACSRPSDSRAREKNSRRKKNEGRLEVYNLTLSPLIMTATLYYLNA